MSYYQNLGLQYLPDGCRPCASVKVGDLVQTKFVFTDAHSAANFWLDVYNRAPDFYVANTAFNALCVAAHDDGYAADEIERWRHFIGPRDNIPDTPYKLKDQP